MWLTTLAAVYFLTSSCALFQSKNRTWDVGTGEIEPFRIESKTGKLINIDKLPSTKDEEFPNDQYLSAIISRAYLVDLPSMFETKEWRLAIRLRTNGQEFNTIINQEGITPTTMNFRDVAVAQYLPWAGEPIEINLDVISLPPKELEAWNHRFKEYLKQSGSIVTPLGMAASSLSKLAGELIDGAFKEKKNQFPFRLNLHPVNSTDQTPISGLIPGKYVMARLRTESVQTVSVETFMNDVHLRNGILFRGDHEFRERSHIIVAIVPTLRRPAYKKLSYYQVFSNAALNWYQSQPNPAIAKIDEALQSLTTQDAEFLTQRDFAARRHYILAYRGIWNSEYPQSQSKESKEQHINAAVNEWLQIPIDAVPADDISAPYLEQTLAYLCSTNTLSMLTAQNRNMLNKLCSPADETALYKPISSRPERPYPPLPVPLPCPYGPCD